MKKKNTDILDNNPKHTYIKVFLIAFATFAVMIIPMLIYSKGYLTYYGDFNSQQIPFYYHAHDAVRNGNFLWDWGTDLGSSFIGSYSFYLLGSPFFWLSVAFPTKMVLYVMPFLLCLKYAVAALTSYAYIRRFVRNNDAAVIGGFLYAFSGFQAYNIFFNHFHDVTAFFPLLLIALEENITKNKRGMFAAVVALMAIINYFFFTGQVLFVLIYFILRSRSSDFRVTAKKFFLLAAEAVMGVGIAAVILIPSALSILDNYRVSEYLYGHDIIAYSDNTRIWRIIQSFFMIPDVPSRPNLFSSGSGKWASIAGYLPMFSMIGVISYLKSRPDKWSSRLIKICIVCAFIPILNSAFYMFNASYYARWYYMPVLIMALMTSHVFEQKDIPAKPGIKGCILFFIAMLIISICPTKEDDKVKWLDFPEDSAYFYICIGVTVLFFIAAVFLFIKKKQNKPYLKKGVIFTIIACLACTSAVFYYGIWIGSYPPLFISTSIKGAEKISIDDSGLYYRIDVSEDYDNFPMLWGQSSMRCFQSIVSPSIMEFYDSMGISRDVASRAETSYYGLRGLFSVKYYFSKISDDDNTEYEEPGLPGFRLIGEQNSFNVYENDYYVPMGFTYDCYVSEEQLSKLSKKLHPNVLMKAICLSDEQIEKYGDIIEPVSKGYTNHLTKDDYLTDCENRIASSCYEFNKSTHGFSAKIKTDKPNLVFFSVPYDKGFTAYVNGEKAKIEKVSNGFMAVYVPEGDNAISFRYVTYGLKQGIQVSCAAVLVFIVYLIICLIIKIRTKKYSRYLQSAAAEIQPDQDTAVLPVDGKSVIDVNLDDTKGE